MSFQSKIQKLKIRFKAAYWSLMKLENDYARSSIKLSFSQFGEDLILWHYFTQQRITKPIYLDIGAYSPMRFNNTMLFYFLGSHGINVEPNPDGYQLLCRHRPRDQNLNVAVGPQNGHAILYRMSDPLLNTINPEEATRLEKKQDTPIIDEIPVKIIGINSLLDEIGHELDLLSLDTETLDLTILESIDFSRFQPKVICVETITFSRFGSGTDIPEIANHLKNQGYSIWGKTIVNTIFVR
jgi:FkbM family methyltransferase